jgi:drug/metabolite transporter (DMT)-like permease
MSSTIANTFTYVAPVIALALSVAFLGEAITPTKAGAAAAALAGVALMMK